MIVEKNNKKIRITNLIGRNFIPKADNPFFALEQLLQQEEPADIHIVDFHAESTAEKIGLATYFDGKITCLVGTHTHVQTADNRILSNGTAFISDVGMTGPFYSIIGANTEQAIYQERMNLRSPLHPALGEGQFSAVILVTDDITNKVISLKRIYITPENKLLSESDN
jgi:hypothetical protein